MKIATIGGAMLVIASVTTASAQPNFGAMINQPNFWSGSNPNSHYVSPYINNRGTYVPPHYQTNPNSTQYDNFGTRGNYNPYTGAFGTRTPRW
jgi:hypothetical protein